MFNSLNRDNSLKFVSYCMTTLLIAAFVAFRWDLGTDWEAYYNFFEGISNATGSIDELHFDVGYTIINHVSSFISNSYTFFLICTTLLSSVLVSYIIYRFSENPHLGQLVFLGTYLPIHFIGSIRRSIAITFVFVALMIAVKAKNKISFSFVALLFAFLQHKTAIIGVFFYIIPKHRFTIRTTSIVVLTTWILGTIGIANILLVALGKLFADAPAVGLIITILNYSGEFAKGYAPQNIDPYMLSTISMLKKVVFLIFFNLALKRETTEFDDVMYNVYVLGVGLYSLFIGAPIVQVIAIYFLFFEVMLVSRSFSRLKLFEKGVFMLYVVLGSYLSFQSGLSVYPELFYPYKSVFFQ